jgi:single stranded DNA-binding protein
MDMICFENGRGVITLAIVAGKNTNYVRVSVAEKNSEEAAKFNKGDMVLARGTLSIEDGIPVLYAYRITSLSEFSDVVVVGRLTSDATIKKVGTKGDTVAEFSVAVNNGREKKANYFNCSYYGINEKLAKWLKKGQEVVVNASIKVDRYKKDGVDKTSTVLTVSSLDLCGGGKAFQDNGGSSAKKEEVNPYATGIINDETPDVPTDELEDNANAFF